MKVGAVGVSDIVGKSVEGDAVVGKRVDGVNVSVGWNEGVVVLKSPSRI